MEIHVIYVLIKHSSDNQRNGCEDQIVQRDIVIIKDALAGESRVERKEKLRNCEYPRNHKGTNQKKKNERFHINQREQNLTKLS